MNITSLEFILFLIISLAAYYSLPERWKPTVLVVLSFAFVASYDFRGIFFLLAMSFLIWDCGIRLQRENESGKDAGAVKVRKRRIVTATIAALSGILILLKYLGPMVIGAFELSLPWNYFIPIGLSYYTLMAISYVMDVYWGKIPAERKYSRLLLFVSYFPQILQGPISRYSDISAEVYAKEHKFQLKNLKYGVQLILWGYFKLLVVGDKTHSYVGKFFHSGAEAYGLAALAGLILFGFELYANFSGGIDVIRGVSQCFGIELTDNFRQPFFSRSLAEFWRRWHMTLGAWMKDYVFFPLSMSRPFSRLKKTLKKHIDKKLAIRIPIAIADVAVFLLVGVWHGLGTNFALWGLYNGLILGFSEIMTVRYQKTKKALKINEDGKAWKAFCVLRTFLIVTLGWATDCAASASGSFQILANMLRVSETNFGLLHASTFGLMKAVFGIVVMIAVDVIHEKGYSVRDEMNRKNIVVQMLFWIIVIQIIACLGRTANLGGLMYAGF